METSSLAPRFLGIAFLVVVATSLASGITAGGIIFSGDAGATMTALASEPAQAYAHIITDILSAVGIVLLATLLYHNFASQSPILARWAYGLWLLEAACSFLSKVFIYGLLVAGRGLSGPASPETLTLGSVLLQTSDYLYTTLMLFYCFGGVIFYSLIWRSRYVPRVISGFGVAAAALGLVGILMGLADVDMPIYVFLPILPFEVGIGLWLVVKGFRTN